MNKKIHILFLILGIYFSPQANFAQETRVQNDTIQDNLGNVADDFQEYFFEALKQKAIENPEKAIAALEKCINLKPEKAILYTELGKNYKMLKNFDSAENNFQMALTKNPEEPQFIYAELFEIYSQSNQYNKAIDAAKELVKWNNEYYTDLANLYMMTKQPERALATLKKVDSLEGPNEYTENLRRKIFEATGDWNGQAVYLQKQIEQNPENSDKYLELIRLYAENGELETAFFWAKKFETEHPESEEVHVALYQLYLKKGAYEKAVAAIKKVLAGTELEESVKVNVIRDFVSFTKEHPEYESTLQEILNLAMKTSKSMASNKELGDFYRDKDKAKALQYYTEALKNNFNNVEMIENTLALQLEFKAFPEAVQLSKKALNIFPSRPKLYLSQGIAYNGLKQFKEALESFDFGLSYLIDNTELEIRFYREMAKAHRG
ncbi:MAG TPA: hypothetical protein VFM82_06455, partial [Flavobacteriaceae bacterium]|nr:hypothetical protein [Flavobacteriaceae bacterium]